MTSTAIAHSPNRARTTTEVAGGWAGAKAFDAALAGASAGVRQEIAIARSGRRLTHTRREIFERWKNLAAPAAVKDSLLKPRSRG